MDTTRKTMRAIVIDGCCAPEDLHVSEIRIPDVKPDWVLVRVHASGMNRAELIMRAKEADESHINTPVVPGIECTGEVADPGDSGLRIGQRVIGIMGGMGRSFDGGYAEYALVPRKNLFTVNSGLPFDELAAIPESWFTAWGSLHECLRLRSGESLIIRGGTSALGIAALTLAKGMGCTVATTTRQGDRGAALYDWGADMVLLDDGTLLKQAADSFPQGFDAALELIGPETLLESMRLVAPDGRVCSTGVLGGIEEIERFDPIKDIPNGVWLTGFFSNYPTQEVIDAIFDFVNENDIHPIIGKRFPLEDAGAAQAAMESSEIFGKAVLVMDR